MTPIPAPSAWPFPRWILRRGRWQMVRTRAPKVDPTAGAEPALF